MAPKYRNNRDIRYSYHKQFLQKRTADLMLLTDHRIALNMSVYFYFLQRWFNLIKSNTLISDNKVQQLVVILIN